jgi:hypothetical protein
MKKELRQVIVAGLRILQAGWNPRPDEEGIMIGNIPPFTNVFAFICCIMER